MVTVVSQSVQIVKLVYLMCLKIKGTAAYLAKKENFCMNQEVFALPVTIIVSHVYQRLIVLPVRMVTMVLAVVINVLKIV